MNKGNGIKTFAGLTFIAGGIIYILFLAGVIGENAGEIFRDYWPASLILLGLALILSTILKRYPARKAFSQIYWSFAIILSGVVLLENRINFITGDSINLWGLIFALLIIYAGIMIMFFKSSIFINSHQDIHVDFSAGSKNKKKNEKSSERGLIGEIRIGDHPWVVKDAGHSLGIGDIYIDFTTALIEEGKSTIDISCGIGDISLVVPEDMPVWINSKVNIGSSQNYKSQGFDEAEKQVFVNANVNIGEVTIKRV